MGDLAEAGPLEMRSTVRAFNLMRDRLDRFVRDRTAMLAAMSHDLRTPITSLRLHAKFVEDERTRAMIVAALDEMQRMTEETLAFIREDMRQEETRTVDLHALIDSVAADLADLGHEIAMLESAASGRVLVACRPVALRRAFRNLLENAGAYGVRATARIVRDDEGLRVVFEDEGPGIPECDLERVMVDCHGNRYYAPGSPTVASRSKSESAVSRVAPWRSAQAAMTMSVAGTVTPLVRAQRASACAALQTSSSMGSSGRVRAKSSRTLLSRCPRAPFHSSS